MGTMILNITLITAFCTIAIGINNAVDEMYNAVLRLVFKCKKHHTIGKPFNCEVCSSFWLSLIYVILTNQLSIISVVACISIATFLPVVIVFIYDTMQLIINKLIGLLK